MKTLRWLPLFLTFVFLLGCYEVNEEIVINENGSGTYVSKMDLAQLLEMAQSFGSEEMAKEGLDKAMDTTIYLKTVADSANDLSAEERELLNKGKVRLQMNIAEKLFKIDSEMPFSNYKELQLLLGGTGGVGSLNGVMKKVFNKNKTEDAEQAPDSPKEPDLSEINAAFDIVVADGTISKRLNKARFDLVMAKPEMAPMKEIGSMGMEVLYTTSFRLPRPVTSSDNPLIKLSADKKTVTLTYNFLDIFSAPEKFGYTITY